MRAESGRRAGRAPRTASALLVSLVALFFVAGPILAAADIGHAAVAATGEVGAQEHGGEALTPENAAEVSRQSVHGEPLWYSFARLVNFAIVVGVLFYYLRAPIAGYLARRSTEIRADLLQAAQMRDRATAQLAAVDEKMRALPAEIEALKARGVEEIAAEEARIRAAAAGERQRLLDQAHRDIDLHLRAAERDLVRRAADLTIGLASDRIKRTITDDDRARLVDRYLADLRTRA